MPTMQLAAFSPDLSDSDNEDNSMQQFEDNLYYDNEDDEDEFIYAPIEAKVQALGEVGGELALMDSSDDDWDGELAPYTRYFDDPDWHYYREDKVEQLFNNLPLIMAQNHRLIVHKELKQMPAGAVGPRVQQLQQLCASGDVLQQLLAGTHPRAANRLSVVTDIALELRDLLPCSTEMLGYVRWNTLCQRFASPPNDRELGLLRMYLERLRLSELRDTFVAQEASTSAPDQGTEGSGKDIRDEATSSASASRGSARVRATLPDRGFVCALQETIMQLDGTELTTRLVEILGMAPCTAPVLSNTLGEMGWDAEALAFAPPLDGPQKEVLQAKLGQCEVVSASEGEVLKHDPFSNTPTLLRLLPVAPKMNRQQLKQWLQERNVEFVDCRMAYMDADHMGWGAVKVTEESLAQVQQQLQGQTLAGVTVQCTVMDDPDGEDRNALKKKEKKKDKKVLPCPQPTETEKSRREKKEKMRADLLKRTADRFLTEGLDQVQFCFIDFECAFLESEVAAPTELGVVCGTLRDGETGCYHKFIHPGLVPAGKLEHTAAHISLQISGIPFRNFTLFEEDYAAIWRELRLSMPEQAMLVAKGSGTESKALQWLCDRAGALGTTVPAIFEYKDLLEVFGIMQQCMSQEPVQKPTKLEIEEQERRHKWYQWEHHRCSYHREQMQEPDGDKWHCALCDVRSYLSGLQYMVNHHYPSLVSRPLPCEDPMAELTGSSPSPSPSPPASTAPEARGLPAPPGPMVQTDGNESTDSESPGSPALATAAAGLPDDEDPCPFSRLLTALQLHHIPTSGPMSGFTIAMSAIIQDHVQRDETHRLDTWLRDRGWSGTQFQSEDQWATLQDALRAKLNAQLRSVASPSLSPVPGDTWSMEAFSDCSL